MHHLQNCVDEPLPRISPIGPEGRGDHPLEIFLIQPPYITLYMVGGNQKISKFSKNVIYGGRYICWSTPVRPYLVRK